ncbi:MBL fold metallo-hydrolase [Luteolibacter sp. LG18]|uniref:MBL fold metallo-hydrolase n=1 Tax=Luteolibacter sp. LG18 TaxID=2819286 RepID=UPI002B2B9B46|nr:MBL fold hydrolase [Luteolibacter sp. LG18]
MNLSLFTGGFVQTNGYLIEAPSGHILVDAPAGVVAWMEQKGIHPTDVLLTHQHYDHVEDVAALHRLGARIHAFAEYSPSLTLEREARSWGMPIAIEPYEVNHLLKIDEPLKINGFVIKLAHVPGHSADSVTFYFPEEGVLFSGDTLFARSVGRFDLPGGDGPLLLDGITRKLLTLPPDTRVFPGHGPSTTVGKEQKANPYL